MKTSNPGSVEKKVEASREMEIAFIFSEKYWLDKAVNSDAFFARCAHYKGTGYGWC